MLEIVPPDYKYCPFCGKRLGKKSGDGTMRKYCSKCDWVYYPHVGMSATAVVVKGGKVLMVKRGRDPYKGKWMFPAGFVAYGEHPREAVARELKEETGLRVVKTKLWGTLQIEDDPRDRGTMGFIYLVEVKDGELVNDREENEAVAWLDINEEMEIAWETNRLVMKMIRKGSLGGELVGE